MNTVQLKQMIPTAFLSGVMTTLAAVLASAPARAGYVDVVAADNPIAYYRLGETTGTVAANLGSTASSAAYVGSPTLGTLGAIVSDPASNRAVTLNGSSQGIRLNNAGDGTPFERNGDSLTLELWLNSTSSTNSRVLSWYATAVGGGQSLYGLYFYGDGRLSFDVRGNDNTYREVIASTVDVNDGAWHQLVGVLNRTAGTMAIYVDGQFKNSISTTGLTTLTSGVVGVPLTMGYQNSATPAYFNGSLDEVAVYGSALTAADVLEHYTAAIPEPAAAALLLLGGGSLLAGRRRRW